VRYFKDRDGDVWASDGDDLAIRIGGQVTEQLEDASPADARPLASIDRAHGPLVELIGLPQKTGEISDGHHTFDELYEHRRALTAVLAVLAIGYPDIQAWRSKEHHPDEGPMFDGSFIVGIELPTGSIIYHYKLKYWDDFNSVPELKHSPRWDGIGPSGTIQRLLAFVRQSVSAEKRMSTVAAPLGREDRQHVVVSALRGLSAEQREALATAGILFDPELMTDEPASTSLEDDK
jgi:hypothetical protein